MSCIGLLNVAGDGAVGQLLREIELAGVTAYRRGTRAAALGGAVTVAVPHSKFKRHKRQNTTVVEGLVIGSVALKWLRARAQ